MNSKQTSRVDEAISISTWNVVQDEEAPVAKQVLAEAIVKLSTAATELTRTGINQRAVIVLLADKTKVSKQTIKLVLNGLEQLRRDYTNI